MSSLAITTSINRVNPSAESIIQTLLEQKEALIQRVDDLKGQLVTLSSNHENKKASLQEEQARWNTEKLAQQIKNEVLQTKNREISQTIAVYQEKFISHRCPRWVMWRNKLNNSRARARYFNQPMESFFYLLECYSGR